jgi:molecular chaperone DnaK (HSP70)
MLYVRATDRVSGTQEGIIVQATQARLTPQEIAQARRDLSELDIFSEEPPEGKPELDEEAQALLNRAQELLDSGTLTTEQATALRRLMQDMVEASTQDDLDRLSEDLLDMLFDLE